MVGVDAFLLAEAYAFPLLVDPTTCAGDFNADQARNLYDLLLLLVHFGEAVGGEANMAPATLDLDNDGMINTSDLLGLLTVFGVPC